MEFSVNKPKRFGKYTDDTRKMEHEAINDIQLKRKVLRLIDMRDRR